MANVKKIPLTNMIYQLEDSLDFPILKLSGNLTQETESKSLIAYVTEYILPKSNKFIIDLKDLHFLNSSGLGALITILTKARKENGEVIIVNINEQIQKLLIITKLNTVFTVAESHVAAFENLKS